MNFFLLMKAVSNLDDWNVVTEVEQYHCYDDHCQCISNELNQIQAKLTLVENAIVASRHHMEVVCIPSLIPNLEGHAFPYTQRGCCSVQPCHHVGHNNNGLGSPF